MWVKVSQAFSFILKVQLENDEVFGTPGEGHYGFVVPNEVSWYSSYAHDPMVHVPIHFNLHESSILYSNIIVYNNR